jgi:hypothetical protein
VRAEEGAGPQVKGSLVCIDWKPKEKKGETFQRDSTRLHKKETYLHKVQNPLTKVLRLHATKSFYIQKEKLKATKKAFISSRVRPWGELTFSQSKPAPCAKESAIAPSAPRFRESPLS